MTAYVIGRFTVTDRDTYMNYASRVAETVAPFGGRYLVKGGEHHWLEGGGHDRHVVIAFEDMETAKGWYESDSYQAIAPLRAASSHGDLVIVNGI